MHADATGRKHSPTGLPSPTFSYLAFSIFLVSPPLTRQPTLSTNAGLRDGNPVSGAETMAVAVRLRNFVVFTNQRDLALRWLLLLMAI